MKKIFTILAALIISANSFIQAQDCLWAKSAGGINYDNGNSISTDAQGNVYISGSFGSPTITFGTTTLTNAGSSDIFIVKYDASGNVLWAKSAGGTVGDYGYGVSTDANGNVYIIGNFSSASITFGSTTLTNANNSGASDIFIAKYDTAGNVLWAKSAGGFSGDYCYGLSTDISGNVYISGGFGSATITFGSTTLTNAGINDIFIAKFDVAGNVLWAKSAGGTSTENGRIVSTDASGNVYMTGHFYSPTISFGSTILTNANNLGNTQDIFITKYNAAGNVLWSKSIGGPSSDSGICVSTDANGNVYITGQFYSPTITFGSTTLTNTVNNYGDIFIAKYNSAGNVLWAKSVGGINEDFGWSVSTDASGNAYISGHFYSPTITFDSTILTNASLTGNGDFFIAKFDASGNVLWAKSAGGSNKEYGYSVSADASGNVYVTGSFGSASITIDSIALSNLGSADIFIAKFSGTSTGLNEIISNNELKIYPNPTKVKFTVNLKLKIYNLKLTVVDVFGKEVYTTKLNSERTEVDLSGIAKGLYFVNVGNIVKKLVIE